MLGYRFEVQSLHSAAEAKRLLRNGMKPWFHAKDGPRGWIVGPFLCLWMSAFDRQGPMVFGRITQDGFGSRISGRAGADLNGTTLFLLMLPVMVFLLIMMHQSGQGTAGAYVASTMLFGVGLPLTLWVNFRSRKEADPLVRFVRKSVGDVKKPIPNGARDKRLSSQPVSGLTMEVNGVEVGYPPSEQALFDVLVGLEQGGFVILSSGPESYMQTALNHDRFILERREGNRRVHWRWRDPLELDEVVEAMCRYLHGPHEIDEAGWQRIRM